MTKWFDANGTDIDAYPERAFKGGVYERYETREGKPLVGWSNGRREITMTRDEHIKWCKERAISELNFYKDDKEACRNAIASMLSDLRKHPDTQNHSGGVVGVMMQMNGHLSTRSEVKEFIEGFN